MFALHLERSWKKLGLALRKSKKTASPISVACSKCKDLGDLLNALAIEKVQLEDENTYVRTILSWISAREPQLGMIISSFKLSDKLGVGYHYT